MFSRLELTCRTRSSKHPACEEKLVLSEDVPAWNILDLQGGSISEEDQATIWEVASKALEDGQRDPERVLQAARRVGRRAHLVDDLRAYATRAIFRVKKTVGRAPAEEEQFPESGLTTEPADYAQVEQIENRILIRELLETLSPLDREIFLRRIAGKTCREIDSAMNLKPRTAEIRSLFCKTAVRKALQEKVDRRT